MFVHRRPSPCRLGFAGDLSHTLRIAPHECNLGALARQLYRGGSAYAARRASEQDECHVGDSSGALERPSSTSVEPSDSSWLALRLQACTQPQESDDRSGRHDALLGHSRRAPSEWHRRNRVARSEGWHRRRRFRLWPVTATPPRRALAPRTCPWAIKDVARLRAQL